MTVGHTAVIAANVALSVPQALDSNYPDKPLDIHGDDRWTYRYIQEALDPGRDALYTKRGLVACTHDRVPVGVMLQVHGKPDVRYRVLG